MLYDKIQHKTLPQVLYFIVQHEYTVLLLIVGFVWEDYWCYPVLFVVRNWILHCMNVGLLLNASRYMLLAKYSITMNWTMENIPST